MKKKMMLMMIVCGSLWMSGCSGSNNQSTEAKDKLSKAIKTFGEMKAYKSKWTTAGNIVVLSDDLLLHEEKRNGNSETISLMKDDVRYSTTEGNDVGGQALKSFMKASVKELGMLSLNANIKDEYYAQLLTYQKDPEVNGVNEIESITQRYLEGEYAPYFALSYDDEKNTLILRCEKPSDFQKKDEEIQKKTNSSFDLMQFGDLRLKKNELQDMTYTFQLNKKGEIEGYTFYVKQYFDDKLQEYTDSYTYEKSDDVNIDTDMIDNFIKQVEEGKIKQFDTVTLPK